MLLPLFVIAVLIALNALYVAAEFSVVAAQKRQIAVMAREGHRRAVGLSAVMEDGAALDRYIAACQIGITLSSLVAGAYGQATIGVRLVPWLQSTFEFGDAAARSTSFLIVLLVLTTLQVVIGELIPKSLALQFPEQTALTTFLPTRWSASLFRGFIWLLNGSGFLLLKPFGVVPGGHQHVHSPQEIAILLAESRRGGNLSEAAHRRLERGLRLSKRTVRQMMTPRGEVDAIEVSTAKDELIRRILDSPYSRLPVYRKTLDQVLGAISTKEVAGRIAEGGELPSLEQLVRPMPFVPGSLRSHRLVRLLQQQRSSKAIVVDEHGGVQGLISMEDVLGELFGEIGDELKQPDADVEPLPDGNVRIAGSMRLDEAEHWLGVFWEGSATTVGGHIVATVGRLPDEGEEFEIEGVKLTIAEMTPKSVGWVIAQPVLAAGQESIKPPAADEEVS